MTDRHFVIAAGRTPEIRARSWALGALLMGVASLVGAADVTVQPASGSGFVVKDSGGATDRFRVQDNGQVSLPSVPGAATQAQNLCIAPSGLLGPCAGGGGGSYSAGTGLSLTGSTFSVAPPYQLPQACAANQVPQWNGLAWICGGGGGGGGLGGSGTAGFLPVWTGSTVLGNSNVFQSGTNVGINAPAPANQLQVGTTPGFSGYQLALGNGVQAMSFSVTPSGPIWYSSTGFSLQSTIGDANVGVGGPAAGHNLDVYGGNAQIGLVNTSNSSTATISKYTNRLEISPSEAFQVSVGGLANPHFWIGGNGFVGVGTTSPASSLQVGSVGSTGYSGHDIAFGNGAQASGIKQTASVAQWYSTTDIALMPRGNGHGRVGINIAAPPYTLTVFDSVTAGPFGYVSFGEHDSSLNTSCQSVGCSATVSIFAESQVLAGQFDAYSDARIKDVVGISNSALDLATINGLQVTDYTLKDKVRNGNKPYKKVIAQQVERVYPQVVSQHVDFIPNVYRTASTVTRTAGGTLLHFDNPHGLSPGAKRLKLLATRDNVMQQVGIVSMPSSRDVVIDVPQLNGDKVFVYGEEVNDFRTVDYEGLTTLNISATQEIAKRLAKQQADLAALAADKDARVAELTDQLARQQSRIAELEALAADLSEIRAQLAVLKRNAAPAQWHDAALRP